MAGRLDRPWARAGLTILALVGTGIAVFGVLAPPERCPSVTADELRNSATETVEWFTRNQRPDGTWLYLYDAGTNRAAPKYNVVRHTGAGVGLYRGHHRRAPVGVRAGVEDGDCHAVGGEGVGVGVWDPLDEAVDAQASQVVGHLSGGVVPPEQPGDQPAKALVGEAGDGVDEHGEGAGQGHGAWIPEAQGSGSLALPCVGL
jgi:hypothetical protein